MSYRIRFTLPDGRTGLWAHDYQTRETAQAAIDDRIADTGFAYTVEEVASPDPKPEPTSTTERLVGLLRDRHARGLAKYGTTLDRTDLAPEDWAQHAIEEALDLAGYLMRLKDGCGQEPGSTAAHHVEILRARVKELEAELAMAKAGLATAPSVPVGASEAPVEGGDSDRSRLESLRAFLDGNEDASLTWWEGEFYAVAEDVAITAPTLLALADKLAEMEAPVEGGDSDRRRFEALERFLDGDTFRQIWKTTQGNIVAGTMIEGQEYAAPTIAALADKLAEKEAKP